MSSGGGGAPPPPPPPTPPPPPPPNNQCGRWIPYDDIREAAGHPWHGVDQRRAFALLRDVLVAVSTGGPAVDALRTRVTDSPNERFNLDVATTNLLENQELCAEVLVVLLDDRRRITAQRLTLFLDRFVRPAQPPGGGGPEYRLPFFVQHGALSWSWFVLDTAAGQDTCVRVLFDLGEMDDVLLPLMGRLPQAYDYYYPGSGLSGAAAVLPPAWGTLGCEEARLREELTGLQRLAHYLFDLEREARRDADADADDADDADADGRGGGLAAKNDRVLEEAILRVLRGINDARRRARDGHPEDRLLDPWSGVLGPALAADPSPYPPGW